MSNFNKEQKILALTQLGDYLLSPEQTLADIIRQAKNKNAWFTEEQVTTSIKATGSLLNKENLVEWIADYNFGTTPKRIGLTLAGNIPMVGFQDILAVLISGNIALIKLSSSDDILIPHILNKLISIEPSFKDQIIIVDKLKDFDAVIATGSDNTSRYFEYYFSKVPHIIRKNRNSIAILNGEEKTEDLKGLGRDILDYFGLGCRNVSKLYVPKGYNFVPFFEAIEEFQPIINHHKYSNNYDYNKSIFLVNKVEHLDNGFLLVSKNEALSSPLSVIYYEEYSSLSETIKDIQGKKNLIQVGVTNINEDFEIATTPFGNSQQPKLWDYADGIDTLNFLSTLN
ncbi:acyl-CoA reductase [Pseudopedobacter beijingensis]|uniref:Acyl-CoA reductase n=1 Tax=Pseudopedobacter beijingensis TaxID=1207056 RepID=A0ABW4IBT9_9SPHI